MAGISRRGEGGGDVDGRAFMVARRGPLPGLRSCILPTGLQPYPTPLPPLREEARPDHFLFLASPWVDIY